jgi:purine-binding chemotaxis protein CheW
MKTSATHGAAEESSWEALARATARVYADRPDERVAIRELLVFSLGSELYAIPVERVREIARMRPITLVPGVPRAILGVVSMRGEIVQVIDLRQRLSMSPAEPTRTSRIVVLQGEDDRLAGLLVDVVIQVMRVREEEIRPAAATESIPIEALFARGRDFVSVIDLKRVLHLDTDG